MDYVRVFVVRTLFAALVLVGCKNTMPPEHVPGSKDPRETMRLDPIRVTATRKDGRDDSGVTIEAYDAKVLFSEAAKHLRKGNCEEAIPLYKKLVDEFENSDLAPLSLYNSGLCNEQGINFAAAARDYLFLVEQYPDARDVTDALFRLAGANEKLESWNDVASVLNIVLNERENLEGIERVEALARKGAALIHLGRNDEAKLALDEAVAIFRTGSGIPPSSSTFYHGMARFKLGEIVENRMRAVELPASESLVEEALERKCQLLLKSQTEYTKTIKVGHPHWAAAAAYRIGYLYRGLWDDMVDAPVPEDLEGEAAALYTEILKDRIRVLLSKAVLQWERTLKMARRLNLDNEWVESTAAMLKEVRETLAMEETGSDGK